MHDNAMDDEADRIRQGLACLSEPSRFRIAIALLRGVWSVSTLAGEVGLSQSCTTRHLQALERAGLVRRERDGKRVLHHLCLDRPEIESLRVLLGERSPTNRSAPGRAVRARRATSGGEPKSVGSTAVVSTGRRDSAAIAAAGGNEAAGHPAGHESIPGMGAVERSALEPAPESGDRPRTSPARRPADRDLEDFLL